MPDALQIDFIVKRVSDFNPEAIEETVVFRNELTLFIRPGALGTTCEFLRDTKGLSFKYLSDITALDRYPIEPRFEMVYHLYSIETGQRLRLKARVSGEDPHIESMVAVWPAANAFEREVFDLFGIRFNGHPDLRRILMPEDWEGHPLRKDYPTEGFR